MLNHEICAVVVLYNPDESALRNLEKCTLVFTKIVVIDNSREVSKLIGFIDVVNKHPIEYVHNAKNHGIATALNQGVKLAISYGFSGVVLLDQDTMIFPKFLKKLVDIYNEESHVAPVAIVGSNYSGSKQGDKCKSVPKKTVITSGCLLSIGAYKSIGSFNESYFIDGVDLEYCLRAKLKGFGVFQSTETIMNHSIGEATTHRLLGLTFTASNHSALRRYYLTRNTIFLSRDYFKLFPVYIIDSVLNVFRIAVYILAFESDKNEKLSSMWSGFKDGCLNISGKRIS